MLMSRSASAVGTSRVSCQGWKEYCGDKHQLTCPDGGFDRFVERLSRAA